MTKRLSPERIARYHAWVINHGDWTGLPAGTTNTIVELLGHIEAVEAELKDAVDACISDAVEIVRLKAAFIDPEVW